MKEEANRCATHKRRTGRKGRREKAARVPPPRETCGVNLLVREISRDQSVDDTQPTFEPVRRLRTSEFKSRGSYDAAAASGCSIAMY